MLRTAALLLLAAASCSAGGKSGLSCMFLGYPDLEYDGDDRTEPLTDKTFNKTVFAPGEQSVVFFHDVPPSDSSYDQYECFLQLSAQIMTERGYDFYTVDTAKEVKLRKQEEIDKGDDVVHVYQGGYQIEYNGVRDPDVFVSWLMDVPDDPVTVINDDEDIEDFEEMEDEVTRVVGYFDPGSADFEAFEEAAEEHMGEVEFFAVVHNTWARKVGLRRVGDVVMYRPYEDEPIWAPVDTDDEDELEDWVEANKEPLMEKLTQENYFDVWRDTDEDHHMIIAFVDEETDEGEAVLELLEELVEENTEHVGTLKIVLIDPDEFALMVDTWEDMFGIDIEGSPQLGLVDISEKDSLWFDMDQLNLDNPEKYADENEEVLQAWIDQILDGTIDIDAGRKRMEQQEAPPASSNKSARRSVYTLLVDVVAAAHHAHRSRRAASDAERLQRRHVAPGDESTPPTVLDRIPWNRRSHHPRRCRRNALHLCNWIEYHLVTKPIILYLVSALLIALLRAMRITLGFYICPVLDDWRDVLRARLPQYVQEWMREHNVRY